MFSHQVIRYDVINMLVSLIQNVTIQGNPTSLTIRKYQRVCSIASAGVKLQSYVGVEMPHSLVTYFPSHPFRPSFERKAFTASPSSVL